LITAFTTADDYHAYFYYDKERRLFVKGEVLESSREPDFEIISEEKIDKSKLKDLSY
jgi:hypothetical protein